MKLTNTILSLFLCVAGYGQSLPQLPLALQWDEAGLRLQAIQQPGIAHTILEPVSPQCFEKLGQDLIGLTANEDCQSITIDFGDLPAIEKEKAEADLVPKGELEWKIQLDRTAPIRGGNSGDGTFILEIAGLPSSYPGYVREIIFKGLDVMVAEADVGATYLERGYDRVRIDVKKCQNRLILFRGGAMNTSLLQEKIPELGEKYNRKYTEYDAFIYESKASVGEKWDFEHVRKLITRYNITNFEDRPLMYLENMLITSSGIGMNLTVDDGNRRDSRRVLHFLTWPDLVRLKIEPFVDGRRIKFTTPYQQVWYFAGSDFFSNVELIQFLEELRASLRATLVLPQ